MMIFIIILIGIFLIPQIIKEQEFKEIFNKEMEEYKNQFLKETSLEDVEFINWHIDWIVEYKKRIKFKDFCEQEGRPSSTYNREFCPFYERQIIWHEEQIIWYKKQTNENKKIIKKVTEENKMMIDMYKSSVTLGIWEDEYRLIKYEEKINNCIEKEEERKRKKEELEKEMEKWSIDELLAWCEEGRRKAEKTLEEVDNFLDEI